LAAAAPAAEVSSSPSPADEVSEDYNLKKELLGYYEKLLTQSLLKSRLDMCMGVTQSFTGDLHTSMSGGFVFRFVPKFYLSRRMKIIHSLYEETKVQTGYSLSPQADMRINNIMNELESYENRTHWKRLALVTGVSSPFDITEIDFQMPKVFAALGWEAFDNSFISIGTTIEESPELTISASFSFFSGMYSTAYWFMERMEKVITHRWVYEYH
ncbi:MAG: hypothetical protein R6V86_04405, partial [Spirochaetia bacterium]